MKEKDSSRIGIMSHIVAPWAPYSMDLNAASSARLMKGSLTFSAVYPYVISNIIVAAGFRKGVSHDQWREREKNSSLKLCG